MLNCLTKECVPWFFCAIFTELQPRQPDGISANGCVSKPEMILCQDAAFAN